MLGQLPNLFDRNFAVGFFLPVVAFIAVSYGLMNAFDLSLVVPLFTATDPTSALAGTAISLIIAWLAAAFLLATNRSIYMLLEGYGKFNPAKLFGWREVQRYQKLTVEKKKLGQAYFRASNDPSKQDEVNWRLGEIDLQLAEQFPDSEQFLLPTRFGNTMRAFEVLMLGV